MLEPKLKANNKIKIIENFQYSITYSTPLTAFSYSSDTSFSDVLENRHSMKHQGEISLNEIGQLLFLSSRTKQRSKNNLGIYIEQRNTPSPGAMHTIDCLISNVNENDWFVYDSRHHSLLALDKNSCTELQSFKADCISLAPECSGYLIWYVCDIERLGGKYTHPESLAYRESGSLSATQGLIAQFLGLGYCTLGLTGNKYANILSDKRQLTGVGVSIVGSIPNTNN